MIETAANRSKNKAKKFSKTFGRTEKLLIFAPRLNGTETTAGKFRQMDYKVLTNTD